MLDLPNKRQRHLSGFRQLTLSEPTPLPDTLEPLPEVHGSRLAAGLSSQGSNRARIHGPSTSLIPGARHRPSRADVTDNGASYRAADFSAALNGARHRCIRPYTPRHNGKVERYNRILAKGCLFARTWTSELRRAHALGILNVHFNYHRPHSAAGNRTQPAALTPAPPTS
ncbi:transposase [Nocardia cyriacigeorgica]|nr:transposase [Nocardia cyriacigeorgica]